MPDDNITRSEIMPVLERIERLSQKNAEALGIVDERQKVMREDVAELKEHQRAANGITSRLAAEQLKAEGALGAIKFMLAITLGGISAGAAVAGIILALVAGIK